MKCRMSLPLLVPAVAAALWLTLPSLVSGQSVTQLPTNEGNMSENLTIPDRSPNANGADREFAGAVASSARRQVADADAALRESRRADVKKVASMVRDGAERIGRRLAAIGATVGSSVASGDALAKRTTFTYSDGAFITDQIEMQRNAIGLFQRECQVGADVGLKRFANLTLPALRRNLQELQELAVD
jgi:predicted outer membrane protein